MNSQKADPVVIQETKYVALGTLICSVIMQAIFFLLGKYDLSVFLGSLVGAAGAIANFWFLGITVQKAAGLEESQVKQRVTLSYNIRMLFMAGAMLIGFLVPAIHWLPLLFSFLFPSLTIRLRGFYLHNKVRKSEKTDT